MMMRARNGEMDAIRSGAFSLKTHIYGRLNSPRLTPQNRWYLNLIIHESTTKTGPGLRAADLYLLIFCLFEK